MIKLNNKGFAVSTILYGILSLTIIILMIVFGIMKSNKDMNQELVSEVEEYMNKCVLSEVELEECYFEGGVCNATKYNDCIGKENNTKFLHEEASVGDFVEYDAGTWAEDSSVATNKFISFGGYSSGSSRGDNSAVCGDASSYTGWRILSIEGTQVKLIHAGIPECMQIDSTVCTSNCADSYMKIITGNNQETLDASLNSSVRDWNNYVNADYAESAKMFDGDEWDNWRAGASSDELVYSSGYLAISDLLYVGEEYYLGSTTSTKVEYIRIGTYGSNGYSALTSKEISDGTKVTKGIRPVVVLKDNIRTSGSMTNTYGKTSWILVK